MRVFAVLEHLEGAKGRLELVGERNGAPIFVDYAHKPDALAKALQALRPYAKRKLSSCSAPAATAMRASARSWARSRLTNADRVIVTDDNPRSEDPAAIRAAILQPRARADEIGDRAEAIRAGIAALEPGDVLLIAGKGHEPGRSSATRRCRSAITKRSRRRLRRGWHEQVAVLDRRRGRAGAGPVGIVPDTANRFRHSQDSRLVKPGSLFVALSGTPSGGFISSFASARDGWEFAARRRPPAPRR